MGSRKEKKKIVIRKKKKKEQKLYTIFGRRYIADAGDGFSAFIKTERQFSFHINSLDNRMRKTPLLRYNFITLHNTRESCAPGSIISISEIYRFLTFLHTTHSLSLFARSSFPLQSHLSKRTRTHSPVVFIFQRRIYPVLKASRTPRITAVADCCCWSSGKQEIKINYAHQTKGRRLKTILSCTV